MCSHVLPLQSGSTALTYASEHGYYRIARDLLKSGADPNIHTEVNLSENEFLRIVKVVCI